MVVDFVATSFDTILKYIIFSFFVLQFHVFF